MLRAQTIGGHRFLARRLIDEAAGKARLRYITDVPGQQAVYITKLAEAEAYLASIVAGQPTAQPGAYVAAEAAVRGISAVQMSELVVALAAQWSGVVGPAIEAARIAAKLQLDAADTVPEIEAARDAAIAALDAL